MVTDMGRKVFEYSNRGTEEIINHKKEDPAGVSAGNFLRNTFLAPVRWFASIAKTVWNTLETVARIPQGIVDVAKGTAKSINNIFKAANETDGRARRRGNRALGVGYSIGAVGEGLLRTAAAVTRDPLMRLKNDYLHREYYATTKPRYTVGFRNADKRMLKSDPAPDRHARKTQKKADKAVHKQARKDARAERKARRQYTPKAQQTAEEIQQTAEEIQQTKRTQPEAQTNRTQPTQTNRTQPETQKPDEPNNGIEANNPEEMTNET